jgi:prepilin-type N-terminal cleavage/methylation domain-containing protein
MSDRLSSESGFTLLEVIVALAIFVVSASSLYMTLDTSVDRASLSATRSEAVAIAQSVLSESLAKSSYENDSGDVDIFTWHITYKAKEDVSDGSSRWRLYTIDTNVSWEHRSKTQSLRFETQRIGPANE